MSVTDIPEISILVTETFLFNILLAVFAFSITNAKTTAENILSRLQVSVFALVFIKTGMPWQELQMCQQVYQFLLF